MDGTLARHALVLGGARSGKTSAGLSWAESLGSRRVYIATAEPLDPEMADRIARHRAERGEGWSTLEAAIDLPAALAEACGGGDGDGGDARPDAILVDCLTLWLSNLMHHGRDPEAETGRLIQALARCETPTILVSNEVGLGLVPDTPLGRAFRDAQGRLNQAVAAAVGNVVFVAAGLPLALKGEGRFSAR